VNVAGDAEFLLQSLPLTFVFDRRALSRSWRLRPPARPDLALEFGESGGAAGIQIDDAEKLSSFGMHDGFRAWHRCWTCDLDHGATEAFALSLNSFRSASAFVLPTQRRPCGFSLEQSRSSRRPRQALSAGQADYRGLVNLDIKLQDCGRASSPRAIRAIVAIPLYTMPAQFQESIVHSNEESFRRRLYLDFPPRPAFSNSSAKSWTLLRRSRQHPGQRAPGEYDVSGNDWEQRTQHRPRLQQALLPRRLPGFHHLTVQRPFNFRASCRRGQFRCVSDER